ncbi:PALP domain-containing protein [Streptomyces sp. NPDC039016]|uniref:pyridoxal-phosphate dependent enzyme n=1 Tax=Streptomyces sp. NPDC039016 TaxID=3154330 RepID=UPI0033C85EBB
MGVGDVAGDGQSSRSGKRPVGGSQLPWSFDFPCVRAAAEPSRADLSQMISQTADVLGIEAPSMEKVRVTDRTLGAGYGQPTEGVWQALRTIAGREGVVLVPVYTGKAAHHLLTATEFEPDVPIVFVHTGGASGLFGYAPEATRSLAPNE